MSRDSPWGLSRDSLGSVPGHYLVKYGLRMIISIAVVFFRDGGAFLVWLSGVQ